MCGRFYIEIDEKELQDIVSAVEKNTRAQPEQMTFEATGRENSIEIFPTNVVPVQTGSGSYQQMKWGFTGFDKKPIINARSETALEKPMFRDSMRERRCLIPASGYYEWKKDGSIKTKYQFYLPNGPMYFAGCWRQEKSSGLLTFVILTRQAVNGAVEIHDRMPVIIPKDHAEAWLHDGPDAMSAAVTMLQIQLAS